MQDCGASVVRSAYYCPDVAHVGSPVVDTIGITLNQEPSDNPQTSCECSVQVEKHFVCHIKHSLSAGLVVGTFWICRTLAMYNSHCE
jgi:hypothetical protein